MKRIRVAESFIGLAAVGVGCSLLWSYSVALIVMGALTLVDCITS